MAATIKAASTVAVDAPKKTPAARGADVGGLQDTLTGLATRRGLIVRLQSLIDARTSEGPPPALILLDLDRFKLVNDSLGPAICDRLLRKIAQRIGSVVPAADMIARVSGDGFAILLRDSADAPAVADRLLDFLGRPYAIGGHAITLGTSVGSAVAGEHGEDALGLLHAADLAMHQAESEGRNRVKRFEPSMQSRALARHTLEVDLRAATSLQQFELRRALISDQFEVHYQPQVTLSDGKLAGFEALLRWRHPDRGLVPPDQFIPMAEEIGLIGLLGDWILRTACRDATLWEIPCGCARPRVAVNVSPFQFGDPVALISGIRRALSESGLPPELLEIELTESAMAGDLIDVLSAIRELGVGLALDDFGTGYSSLGRLKTLPFSKLKIDRSFVIGLGEKGDAKAKVAGEWMIRAIASLGVGLGMKTIVEGVETKEQADIARTVGCSEIQGYLVSRPVAASSVNALIARLHTSTPEGILP